MKAIGIAILLLPAKLSLWAVCTLLLLSGLIHLPILWAANWLAGKIYPEGNFPGNDPKFNGD